MTDIIVPTPRPDLAAVSLDGATVIHRDGRLHTLDPLATLVWRCCDGRATVDEIAADLAPAFAVPRERARHDVGAVIEELARLDLLVAPGADVGATEGALDVLADPPGSCASCAEREWPARTTVRVGSRLVNVGTDSTRVDAVIRAALAAHVTPTPPGLEGEPPFLAISAPGEMPDHGPRRLHLLHRGDTVLARSRGAGSVVSALVAYLASFGDLAALGLAALDGVVVAKGGRALIVPEPDEPVRFRHELAAYDMQVADIPVAVVDATRAELVVGAPGLTVERAALGESEAPPIPWGTLSIAALGVAGAPSPSRALLTFAPERGDHRDHDASLAALVALGTSVPVVEAGEPDAIAAQLDPAGSRRG